jgi:hypothetical protein
MAWNISKSAKIDQQQLAQLIKKELISAPATAKLLEQFDVDPEHLNKLHIEFADLDKKYAETDADKMLLNISMFREGWDAFKSKYFFVVAHEIVHWLSRQAEEQAYFNDPEEVLGFVSSIAYEISKGTHPDEIYNKVYPKVSWHFHDEADAKEFFSNMVEKANIMLFGNNDTR